VHPLAEELGHADGVSGYARFLEQVAFAPGFDVVAESRRTVTEGLVTAVERLLAQLGELPVELRVRRVALAMRYVVHALADHERALEARVATTPTALLVSDLVDTAEAIVTAPVSQATELETRRAPQTRGLNGKQLMTDVRTDNSTRERDPSAGLDAVRVRMEDYDVELGRLVISPRSASGSQACRGSTSTFARSRPHWGPRSVGSTSRRSFPTPRSPSCAAPCSTTK